MYKYCIETDYWMIRDLSVSLWKFEYLPDYKEQKYFKTKTEMRTAFTKEYRFVKGWMEARRKKIDNCHNKVIVYKEKGQLWRSICMCDRYFQTNHDFVSIRCIELDSKKDRG